MLSPITRRKKAPSGTGYVNYLSHNYDIFGGGRPTVGLLRNLKQNPLTKQRKYFLFEKCRKNFRTLH
jgi:hypothetical protein